MIRLLLSIAVLAAACGPPPGVRRAQSLLDRGDYRGATEAADAELANRPRSARLWRIKIDAAMLAGDSARAAASYAEWRRLRGEHDSAALERMAKLTLWRGLVAPSAELRVLSIRAVERLEIEALADEVAELIGSDEDRVAAAAAVALLRSHPVAARIAANLLSSPDERARAAVIAGISRKIPELAGDELRAALADPAAAVRRQAVAAVLRLGDAADSEALAALARGDSDREVRARALRALAREPYPVSSAQAQGGLADPYLGVRLAALQVAADRLGGAGRAMLIEASRSPDLPVAIRAAVLLGPGPGWTALFGRALAAPEWPTRAAAVAAVTDGLGAEAATASARRALGDARIEVRLAAARALLRLGHEAPARAELARAAAASPPHLGAAAELARRWRDPAALAALATLAGAADRDARAAAIAAHGSVEHISDALVAALADSAVELRIAAAAAILEAQDKNR